MIMRKKISYLLKCLTVVASLGGVTVSLVFAKSHGYSHWARRLLYFTAQSNVWIGLTFLTLVILPFTRKKARTERFLYVLKYVFTVSIAMTGVIFCFLLAPFGDERYHLWSFSSYLTHVFSPAFAIADFFVDDTPLPVRGKQAFLAVLPPLFYILWASVLGFLNIDFGRGEAYPYFFLNYRSPAGIFGFSKELPFVVGSFYWILLFSLLIFVLGHSFLRIRKRAEKRS